MKLFRIKNWQLELEPEVWGYTPFKKLLDRDKTKDKQIAFKEMFFIYNYADVKSDYIQITNEKEKIKEIKKDIGLPSSWKIDKTIKEALEFYTRRSVTTVEELYKAANKAAGDIANFLKSTDTLLKERDTNGKPVFTLNSITGSLKQVPDIMKNLKSSYKELIKEKEDKENRKSGARAFNLFEDGLT